MLARHRAQRRLQAHHAGVRGRPPDRAAAVLANRERGDTGCQRGNGAAAGTAGGELQVPRIAGDAEHRVGGVAFERELGYVGLADDENPGGARTRHRQLVVGTAAIAQRRCAPGGGLVEREQAVLHRERDAVERRQRLSPRMALGRSAGLVQELRIAPRDHRVELRVDGFQPRQTGLRHCQRRQGAASKSLRHVAGAEAPQAVVVRHLHLLMLRWPCRGRRRARCGCRSRRAAPAPRCPGW